MHSNYISLQPQLCQFAPSGLWFHPADGHRISAPWIGRTGLVITGIMFPSGSALIRQNTIATYGFTASAHQTMGAIAAIILLVGAALVLRGSKSATAGANANSNINAHRTPGIWLAGAVSLAAGSLFIEMPHPSCWQWLHAE
jgi:hypothetical protein